MTTMRYLTAGSIATAGEQGSLQQGPEVWGTGVDQSGGFGLGQEAGDRFVDMRHPSPCPVVADQAIPKRLLQYGFQDRQDAVGGSLAGAFFFRGCRFITICPF